MMKPGIALAILAVIVCPRPASAQDRDWQRYTVPATGAVVEIPAAIFSEKDSAASKTDYAQRFLTPDHRATLTIQSIPNKDHESTAIFLARLRPPSNVTYKRITPKFFVVSSIRDGKIWYDRCNRGAGVMNCVLINYPIGEKRQWDGIVTRISRTLDTGS